MQTDLFIPLETLQATATRKAKRKNDFIEKFITNSFTSENRKITTAYNFKFRSNCIIKTETREWLHENWDTVRTKQNENLKDNSTKGKLSKQSKSKLKQSINWLVIAAQKKNVKSLKYNQVFKFKINFITLTIPPQEEEIIQEKKFKTILNTWLTYHRKYSNLNNYVWKIEKHKDNRLHIHILADTFIHHKSVKDSWNLILKRNGLLENHYNKFSNYDPNSTDIHSIKKVKKVAAYVVKYMAKSNEEDPSYFGRVWSCSSKISTVMQNKIEVSPDKISEFTKVLYKKNIEFDTIKTEPNQFGQCYEIGEIFFLKAKDWISLQGSMIFDFYKELILSLRNDSSYKNQLEITYKI